jgi:thiol-disulfide isomerase/thioredoxin
MRHPWKAPARLLAVAAVAAVALAGCKSGRSPKAEPSKAASPATEGPANRPVFVRGPTGGQAIAPFVAAALKEGKRTRHGVLVYVGATWCEPCQQFHHAVEKGELDDLLSGVRLIEFDADADRDALTAAGYQSELIPLFALPNDDGTGSDRRIQGSIKGPSAVQQNLEPRLRAFLRGQAEG